MHPLLKIFFTGMLVSFLGSLPLGTLNILAMKISIEETITAAMLFSFGSLSVEIIYVRLSLVAMDWVRKQEKIFKILEWVTLGIVLALAIASFYAAMHPTVGGDAKRDSLPAMNRFLFGALMCAVNPVQIPFWFGWSTVLFSKGILHPVKSQYNVYILGIGLGTLMGNCIFIFGGKWLVERIHNSEAYLNWIIGGIFAVSALIQLYKILTHKDAVDKIQHIDEKDIPPDPVDDEEEEEQTMDHRP